MAEMEELKILEQLQIKATQGDAIRDLVKHPGFKLYHDKIKESIDKYQKSLLKVNIEKAREGFYKAQGLNEALEILVKFQNIGAIAKSEIQRHNVES